MGALKFNSDVYSVMIGYPRDTSVMTGFLERTGTGTISTTFRDGVLPWAVPQGDEYIPNRTVAWGRRINSDGHTIDSVSDPKYNGKIELMDFGDEGGIPIELRYMQTSPSLDYLYQVRIGMPEYNTEKSREFDYLALKTGQHDIDLKKERNKAIFLKAHSLNENSPCKSPNTSGEGVSSVMRDIVEFNTTDKLATEADERFDAITLIKSATTFNKLNVLKSVINPIGLDYNLADQNDLFAALKVYADKNATEVLKKWNEYRGTVAALIEKFKVFNAIEFSKDGFIAIGQEPNRKVTVHSLPKGVKKDSIGEYLLQNVLEDEVQEIISHMEVLNNSLK